MYEQLYVSVLIPTLSVTTHGHTYLPSFKLKIYKNQVKLWRERYGHDPLPPRTGHLLWREVVLLSTRCISLEVKGERKKIIRGVRANSSSTDALLFYFAPSPWLFGMASNDDDECVGRIFAGLSTALTTDPCAYICRRPNHDPPYSGAHVHRTHGRAAQCSARVLACDDLKTKHTPLADTCGPSSAVLALIIYTPWHDDK